MLNQQNAIVQVLTGGFSPPRRGLEAFRVMPFVQLCILNLLGIPRCWDCMFCVAEVHECVCVCVCGGGLSLSLSLARTLACKTMHAQKHFHLRREARPPSAFLTCNHVQICTGRQREGESHVNLCGCFLFFFFFFYKARFWLLPISSAQDPNLLLKPFKTRGSHFFLLFPRPQVKTVLGERERNTISANVTSTWM